MNIHPSAIVHEGAILEEDVAIGPFCIIGKDVCIKKGTKLHAHVCIEGDTKIGAYCEVFPFASIGSAPQDLKHQPDDISIVEIGDHVIMREGVTINGGTKLGGSLTKIGSHCVLLMYSHVAHDCRIGEHTTLSNQVLLGGHCEIGSHVVIGGASAVHQFTRVGDHAFLGGMSAISADVPPFAYAHAIGTLQTIYGINIIGLRRRGFTGHDIRTLQMAFDCFFVECKDMLHVERVETLKKRFSPLQDRNIESFIAFLENKGKRPLCLRYSHGSDLMHGENSHSEAKSEELSAPPQKETQPAGSCVL